MSLFRITKKFRLILSSHQKLRILELAVLMIGGGLLETCSVSLMLPFMNIIMKPEETMEKGNVRWICGLLNIDSSRTFLLFITVALAAIYVFKNLYLLFEYNIQYRFVYRNMFAMQQRLLDSFIHRPYEYFLKVNSGEIVRIIGGDTNSTFQMLVTLLNLLTELVVSVMLIAAIFAITPVVTAVIAVVLFVLVAAIHMFLKPMMRSAALSQQKASVGMTKWLLQSIQGIKELKVMARERFFQENYDRYGWRYVDAVRHSQVYGLFPRFFIEAVCMGTLFFVVAFLIYHGSELESLVPMLSAVAMAAIRLLPSVNRISAAMASVAYNEPMLDKLIENLQDVGEKKDEICKSTFDLPDLAKDICLHQITYRYPDASENVLTEASLKIRKGESIGIVGSSGAGKTTAVDIMLGLLVPEKGQVLADGTDIRQNLSAWLRQLGYIPQTIFMLDDTIYANVAFGTYSPKQSEKEVWKALEEASLADFVRSLPEGLYTQIGERGVRLSGGQRQRIGIARALFRNPEVLIFDEATSALDHDTESAIMESIHRLQGQKTMVIIAHRLSTIEQCDHIYRVENGKITQER